MASQQGMTGINRVLGGVSSVLRIGMDSKSQLDNVHTIGSPMHDRSLNNTKNKFNFGTGNNTAATAVNEDLINGSNANDLDRSGQILI